MHSGGLSKPLTNRDSHGYALWTANSNGDPNEYTHHHTDLCADVDVYAHLHGDEYSNTD